MNSQPQNSQILQILKSLEIYKKEHKERIQDKENCIKDMEKMIDSSECKVVISGEMYRNTILSITDIKKIIDEDISYKKAIIIDADIAFVEILSSDIIS